MTGMLLQDDRSWLYSEHPERYAIGPEGAPWVVLNAADSFGCAWAADEPEGWDAPTVATPSDAKPQAHGSWLGESFYEERVLTVTEGLCTAPDRQGMQLARRRLLRALNADLAGLIRYTHLDEQPPRGLWVRPVGKVRVRAVTDRAFLFSFTLVAEDPLKTGTTATHGPLTTAAPGKARGRRYPRRYRYGYGGGERTTALHIPNDGDEDAHAVYRILGPIDRPVLQFPAIRWQLGLAARLGAGDTLIADTRAGVVRLNGVNRYDVLSAGSTLPLIPPGGVQVQLRSLAGTSWPDARAYIDTAPTWL